MRPGAIPLVADLIDLRFWLSAAKLGWRFANVPEVVGEHYVHDASWFHRAIEYVDAAAGSRAGAGQGRPRARAAAVDVPLRAGPTHLRLSSAGLKRVLRRGSGESREQDL